VSTNKWIVLVAVAYLFVLFVDTAYGFAQEKKPATPPTISDATKVKYLNAQHDLDQLNLQYVQLQSQVAQVQQKAIAAYAALGAVKEEAYKESGADQSDWTIDEKAEFESTKKVPPAPVPVVKDK
jgi:hypothetical protein